MRGRVFGIGLAGLLMAGAGAAQRYTPPPPPLSVDPCAAKTAGAAAGDAKVKCPPTVAPATPAPPAGAPSAAEQFPFPGSTPVSAPGAQKAAPAKGAAADKFPYPGETSASPDAVPEGNTPRYVPDAPAPGSGESSSSSSSSSTGGDAGTGGEGAGDDKAADPERALPKPKGRRPLPKVSPLTPDERVSQDLEIAKFYSDRGNFQAAYLRAKDATKIMPEDGESHFVLAQAAERLQKKDEAAAEYAAYLKLDPGGEKSKVAQRALAQLR